MARFGAEIRLKVPLPVDTQEEAVIACMQIATRASSLVKSNVMVEVAGYEIVEGEEKGKEPNLKFWDFLE